ncbi:MAG: hypothetical protein E1N59_3173 [Puniceicoccaceae bacterium 5H]|nr:MAG: hypothetical protein E1N59_3173 [Puniceicoccaceae bacterium 5H]
MTALIADNISCLEQGRELLRTLPAELYHQKCPQCFNSTMGGHMRHNTDHYECFLKGYATGRVDYDDRTRDTMIETDPAYAEGVLARLADGLEQMDASLLDAPLQVKMDGGESQEWSPSSVRRELQFLLSHTIHHYALMVAIGQCSGFNTFPDRFGVAPSTLKHRAVRA